MTPSPAGASPQPQQPPFGASPVTGPSQNAGYEAAVAARLGTVLNQLTDLLKMAGAGSEAGKDILKVMQIISKHVPAGSVTPGAERGNIERMAMKNTQNNAQMQALKQQQAQGAQQQGAAQQPPQAAAA